MSQGALAQFLPLILIVLAFWFLVIRPSRKRSADMNRLQSGVTVGTEVMLGSGIFGTVAEVGDQEVRLEIAPGTVIKVSRKAVVRVVEPGDEPPEAEEEVTWSA